MRWHATWGAVSYTHLDVYKRQELGRKKMIGGQEDMIVDTAMTMAKERGLSPGTMADSAPVQAA